jgi:peptide/nickel transport system substrate-binding protein
VQNKSLKVTKNPTYWRKDDQGRQLPFLDEMEFRPITDDGGKEKALAANDVDLALATSAELASRSEVDYDVIKDYTSERTFIMLNTATGDGNKGNPFGNVHARRAVAMATDRVTIAELVGEGVQTTSQGYRPESKWGIPESQTNYPAFDVEKAKAEVEAYKKDTGESTLSFTLTGLTSVGG